MILILYGFDSCIKGRTHGFNVHGSAIEWSMYAENFIQWGMVTKVMDG